MAEKFVVPEADAAGRFGEFGGRFVPAASGATLVAEVWAREQAFVAEGRRRGLRDSSGLVSLLVAAEAPPEELYTEGPLAHEFPRTVSRLQEMQSADYLALERREVDTRIT